MRTSVGFVFLALATASAALTIPVRRQDAPFDNCPAVDDVGSQLLAVSTEGEDTICVYETAGQCEYFISNGTFGSGSSDCPDAALQAGDPAVGTPVEQAQQFQEPPPEEEPAPPPAEEEAPPARAKEPPPAEEKYEPPAEEHKEEPKYTPTEHYPEPTPYKPEEPYEEPKHEPEPPKPTYGSGHKEWKDYDDCVATCLAQYPLPDSKWTQPAPTPTEPSDADSPANTGGVAGTGATHTVIVAPSQGVFRYVPMAVNATIGDTIEFVWRASPHTVTKSSALQVCNASTDAAEFFTSGRQEAPFVYREVVNNTDPVYYYCGVATHCQQGMFGILNPRSSAGASTSVASMMPQWVEANAEVRALFNYTQSRVAGTTAELWGDSLDVADIPPEAHAQFAENVLYTRLFLGSNPESFKDGEFVPTAELNIPQDIRQFLGGQAPEAPANRGDAPPPAQESQPPANTNPSDNAAGLSVVMSPAVVAAVGAVLATLFAF